MMKRRMASCTLALLLLTGACGGGTSEPLQQPVPAVNSASSISEADAVMRAQAVAADEGLSIEGLSMKPSNIFGEWQVSFEPTNGGSLAGGFLVVLKADTGEFLELIEYK